MTARRAEGEEKETHVTFQAAIVDAMNLYGYTHLHVRRSIGKGKRWVTATSLAGWPDLLAWSPKGGFIAIEVKCHPDKPTPEQLAVLASLEAAGARALVAYPEDWPQVEAILRGVPNGG